MVSSVSVRFLEAGLLGLLALTVYYVVTTPTVLCVISLAVLWNVYRRERKRAAGTIPLSDKYVLITGCDSGFGNALAFRLHELKCHVIATVLQPDGPGARELCDVSSDRMTVLPLDVSSDDSVSKCLEAVKDICKDVGLWGLVNNAGRNCNGPLELVTMRQYMHVANINLFGMVRMTRAFLPLIRQAKGRIVNVTSVHGRCPIFNNAAYSITKFAGETFSDITRLEMAQFGVKVVAIAPGAFGFSTNVINPAVMRADLEERWAEASAEAKQVYKKEHFENFVKNLETRKATQAPGPVTPVIDAMVEALTSADPEFRYLVDGLRTTIDKYCWMVRLRPYVPDRLFHKMSLRMLP